MSVSCMKRQTLRYVPLENMEFAPKEIKRNSVLCYLVVFWYDKQIKDICNAIYCLQCIPFFDELCKVSVRRRMTDTFSFVDMHLMGHYGAFCYFVPAIPYNSSAL